MRTRVWLAGSQFGWTRRPSGGGMKVVAVDDSKQFQRSLTRLPSTVGGVAIVGYAVDVDSAHKLIDDTEPHVVVLDIELRGGARGIDVLR